MTQPQRKTIQQLLEMSTTEVREYLQTLPPVEQKTVGEQLYKAMLSFDMKRAIYYPVGNSQNTLQ